jgi:fluoride exporter
MPPTGNIIAVALGGMVGASARYLLVLAWPNPERGFPQTTFLENIVGAFLLGLLLAAVMRGWRWRADLRPFVGVGVLGSFTTFSALTEDIVRLADDGRAEVALAYAMASVAAGLASAGAGIALGRRLTGRVVRP